METVTAFIMSGTVGEFRLSIKALIEESFLATLLKFYHYHLLYMIKVHNYDTIFYTLYNLKPNT